MVEMVAAITNQVANTDFSIIVLILHKKELKLKKHLIMQLHTIKHVSQNQFTMWSKAMYEVTFNFDTYSIKVTDQRRQKMEPNRTS